MEDVLKAQMTPAAQQRCTMGDSAGSAALSRLLQMYVTRTLGAADSLGASSPPKKPASSCRALLDRADSI